MLQHKKLYDSLSLLFYNLVEPLYSEYLNEYDQIKKQWINEEIGRQKHQLAIQGNFGLKFMELCDREKEIDATAEIIRKKIDQFLGSDQLSTYLFLYGHVDQANNISGRESLLDSILCEIIYLAAIRTGKSQLIRKAKKYRINGQIKNHIRHFADTGHNIFTEYMIKKLNLKQYSIFLVKYSDQPADEFHINKIRKWCIENLKHPFLIGYNYGNFWCEEEAMAFKLAWIDCF